MIDTHAHILPGMDDGASSADEALAILKDSYQQGIDTIVATPHFYAFEEDPAAFLRRRAEALEKIRENDSGVEIIPGAEIYYYPGISESQEMKDLSFRGFILVEPPMEPWSDYMLDEIELLVGMRIVPVIAHVDRYMRLLDDMTLMDRLKGRRILAQFNMSAFIHEDFRDTALRYLSEGRISFLGSDVHNTFDRVQNYGKAAGIIRDSGLVKELADINGKAYAVLKPEQLRQGNA